MKRWAINLLCGLSLLICVATIGLWPLNYVFRQYVTYGRPLNKDGRRWIGNIYADSDGLTFVLARNQRTDARYKPLVGWRFVAGHYPPGVSGGIYHGNRSLLGFRAVSVPEKTAYQRVPVALVKTWVFGIPYWFIILVSAIPPLLWVRRWRGQRGRGFPVEVPHCMATNLDRDTLPTGQSSSSGSRGPAKAIQ